MKKFITALTALLTLTISATAMSYSQARERALFLTDKMAYELNLTEEQYEAAYEVNLDYLMSINTYDDLYGVYWRNRNLDLSYILMDWQYRAFCAANYFYRPMYWNAGAWHFSIYARYPHRTYFYFGRPSFYATYRGGHGWRSNGGRSWYRGRSFNHGVIARGHGMKDRFDRGDFRNRPGVGPNRPNMRPGRGDDRRPGRNDNFRPGRNDRGDRNNNVIRFGGDRNNIGRNDEAMNRPLGDKNDQNRPQRFTSGNRNNSNNNNQGGNRSTPQRNFGGNRNEGRVNRESSTRTTVRPQRMSGNTVNRFNGSGSGRSTLPTRPNSTFSPRSNSGSNSSVRSSQSRQSSGSGSFSRNSGGGHFGGRR